MTARANNSHRQLVATISTEVARGNCCGWSYAQLQAVVSGGGGNAVVEVLGVAMEVIPEPHRASPRPRRASPPRAAQPRKKLLHRRSRPAAAPIVYPPSLAAAAGVHA